MTKEKQQQSDSINKQEKPSTFNEKGQKIVLILIAIVAIALIISLFTGGNKTTPQPTKQDVDKAMGTGNYQQSSGFMDQLNMENQQTNKETEQQALIHGEAQEQTPAEWRKTEELRVLDSRKTDFGFEVKRNTKNGTNTISQQPNNIAQSQENLTQINNIASQKPTPQPKYTYNGNQRGIASNRGYSGFDINRAGDNIVGRGVNDRYDKAVQNGDLLIPTGTIISATLDQDVISDYSGTWIGHTTRDVYSTDKQFILIPAGAKVLGQSLHVGSVNEPIQSRMGFTVQWIILPNGRRIDLRMGNVEDSAGVAEVSGDVNRHLLWQFGGVAAYALLSASMPRDQVNMYGYYEHITFKGQFSKGIRQQLYPLVSKYLSLVPTVTIKAGTPLKIIFKDDAYTQPWARVNTTVYRVSY